MYTVTSRIDSIKQPRGGFINPSSFNITVLSDEADLHEDENLSPSMVGTVVDYLTRYNNGTDKIDAFEVPLQGAFIAQNYGAIKSAEKVIEPLLEGIRGIDDTSIINSCKLASFDVWKRNRVAAMNANGYTEINPDKATIENIRTMVKRGLSFFEEYGPVTSDGFTFEPENADKKEYAKRMMNKESYGGYTYVVSTGDGDFLTEDTLWDFKVIKSKPTSKHTMQLLMYWIMGQHSGQKKYNSIRYLGIFNPRLNTVYRLEVNKIPADLIKFVEKEIICY